MRFKEGDIVRISKQSIFYGLSKYNPKDINGIITRIDTDSGYPIGVKWYNGACRYNYREEDLKLYRRKDAV